MTDHTSASPANDHGIFDLVEAKKWEAVMQALRDHPEIASVVPTEDSKIVLHEACKNEPPMDVVDMLLAICPNAASTKGQMGMLPVHHACCSGASADIIERLIQANRTGIRTTEEDSKMLPLHMACKSGADKDVIMTLLIHYPEASLVRDIYDRVPLDYAHSVRDLEVRKVTIETLKQSSMLCVTSESARERLEDEYESKIRGIEEGNAANLNALTASHEKSLSKMKKIAENRKIMEVDMRLQLAERDQHIQALEKAMAEQERSYKHLLKVEKGKVADLEAVVENLDQVIATKIVEKQDVDDHLAHTQLRLSESRKECQGLRDELADRDSVMDNINSLLVNFKNNAVPTTPAPTDEYVSTLNTNIVDGEESEDDSEPEMDIAPTKGSSMKVTIPKELSTPVPLDRVGESFESEAGRQPADADARCE